MTAILQVNSLPILIVRLQRTGHTNIDSAKWVFFGFLTAQQDIVYHLTRLKFSPRQA